jgi:hypothetical protein
MRMKRIHQIALMRHYQHLENVERRRKAAEAIKGQKGFLKKLFSRG